MTISLHLMKKTVKCSTQGNSVKARRLAQKDRTDSKGDTGAYE